LDIVKNYGDARKKSSLMIGGDGRANN